MLLDPLAMSSVELDNLNQLPDCSAIYFAIDSQNRILYIGQAVNLLTRCKNNHRIYQLQEINQDYPVRIAWQVCNNEELNEIELYLIKHFQPLLNRTQVKSPQIVPSELVFQNFLREFSRRLIIIGFKPQTSQELPHIHLKYDWKDCSPKGTAAKIKNFIQENNHINTSFKIRRKPWGRIRGPEEFQIGSRGQKALARQNRSYNNHWEMACNGVIISITPTNNYKQIKSVTNFQKLAGVKMRTIPEHDFKRMSNQYPHDFADLSCFVDDLVPLLWIEG